MNKFKLLSFALLLSFGAITISAKSNGSDQKRSYGPQVSTGTSSLATAQFTKPITPAQVNNTGGYEIKASGYYFLTEDLFFYPKFFKNDGLTDEVAVSKLAAIYIATDNVVLDLNNKTISHLDSKSATQDPTSGLYTSGYAIDNSVAPAGSNNIAGITLAPGVKNVTIKNGTLNYILGNGILVNAAAASSAGATSNISIDNINVINCGREGILVGDIAKVQVTDVSISNSSVSHCSGTIKYGDLSLDANTGSVTAGDINLTGTGYALGISLNNVANAVIANTSASHNQIDVLGQAGDDDPAGGTGTVIGTILSDNTDYAIGCLLNVCENVRVENSVFNNQRGPCAFGMKVSVSNNVNVKNSQANDNAVQPVIVNLGGTDTSPAGNNCSENSAAGFYMEGALFCNFEDCAANNNSGYYAAKDETVGATVSEIASKHTAGFLMTVQNATSPFYPCDYNSFVRCQANHNKSGRTPTEADPDVVAWTDNNYDNLDLANAVNVVYGAGFLSLGWATAAGAIAENHPSLAADSVNSGNMFKECQADGNYGFAGDMVGDTTCAGIALVYDHASTIENCRCFSNGVLSDETIPGYGIYLGPIGNSAGVKPEGNTLPQAYSRNGLIRGNWLVGNSWCGLMDHAYDCQTLIMSNYAFRNGTTDSVLSEGNKLSGSITDLNYYVRYEQENENLPVADAIISDFGALSVAHAYANIDINVLQSSPQIGDPQYPVAAVDDVA